MKTNNRKILQLINHGFSGNLLSDLNEGQINVLYKRLVESKSKKCGCGCDKETCTCGPDCKKCDCGRQKKETKEDTNETVMVSGKNTAEVEKLKQTGTTFEVYEDTDSEMDWLMKGDTQDPVQKGPTGDGDPDSLQE